MSGDGGLGEGNFGAAVDIHVRTTCDGGLRASLMLLYGMLNNESPKPSSTSGLGTTLEA